MSMLHGTACQRQCGSIATKPSRLDTCEGWKVVRWCRTQASSHNSISVIDGGVDKGGYEHCGTRQAGWLWLLAELLLQHPNRSQQATSGARHVMSVSCEVTQGVGDT